MNFIKFEDAFSKHTGNEFPPKYVFYATENGDVGVIKLKELKDVEVTHNCIGMTVDSTSHNHLLAAGNLPILKLRLI